MKKITSFILAVLLLAIFAVGCSDKGGADTQDGKVDASALLSPDDPVTLSMWHVYGEQSDSPMNRLVEEFNSTVGLERGIVISVTNVTSTSKISGQLADSVNEVPGSLERPDLFSSHTYTAVAMGTETLVDWNLHFTEEELQGYVPEFIEDGTKDGALVVFPVSKSTYALFLNGSQFERFSADTGVTYDSLSTWEGFFDAAGKYYEWSQGKPFCAFDYLIRHIELDIMSRGEELVYSEDGWYDTSSAALRESFDMFAAALAQGHIAIADQYANTQVMTGETLSGIGSTAAIGYYNDTVTYPDNTSEPTNLRVLPLPMTGEGQEYMPMTGVGLAAFRTTDKKAAAAAEFLRWFTQGERNLDFVVDTGYMPVNNDAYAAISDYGFESDGYRSLYTAIRTMRESYTPVVRPDFDGYYAKVDKLYDSLRSALPSIIERADNGEDIDTLTGELWPLLSAAGTN